jgi:hypothetical protein
LCRVGRRKRDAPSEPYDWYSDGACVQSELFAMLRLAARTNVRRAHPASLLCTSGIVLTCWLLVIRILQALKLSTDFIEVFKSACSLILKLLQTERRGQVSRYITATLRF